MSFSLLSHDAAERDNRADDGEEDEEDWSHTLHGESVSDVSQVVRVAVPDVVDEAAE